MDEIELDPPLTADELLKMVGDMFPLQLQLAAQELRYARLGEMYARAIERAVDEPGDVEPNDNSGA
jgi:hypothetical protein